jgi:hypothetical protein
MKADDVKRLTQLERENATLKLIVADKELENVALKEARREASRSGPEAPGGRDAARPPRPLERRACLIAGQHRSPAPRAHDRAAEAPPRGPRCATSRRRSPASATTAPGPPCRGALGGQPQGAQRIWREEGLRVLARTVPRPRVRRSRVANGLVGRNRARAGLGAARAAAWYRRSTHRGGGPCAMSGALDFQADETADGRQLRLLSVVDEFTREGARDRASRTSAATTAPS